MTLYKLQILSLIQIIVKDDGSKKKKSAPKYLKKTATLTFFE